MLDSLQWLCTMLKIKLWNIHHSDNQSTYDIYPIEVEIKYTTVTDTCRPASYLDLYLDIDSEGRLRTKLYDKRDYFDFAIVNFPFICSNIPAAPAYGEYLSQLIRYSRAWAFYQDFHDRGLLLTRKILNQWLILLKLKSSLRKF